MKDRRTRRSDLLSDKDNVADQPGLQILFVGLLISIVLGVSIRGVTHPSRVRALIETAARNIHPELKVSFDSAHFAFADGPWPVWGVEIERVRMESDRTCWMGPRLFADRIRIPISFTSLIFSGQAFRSIQAGEVEVRLTRKFDSECNQDSVVEASAPEAEGRVSLVRTPITENGLQTSGSIDHISFTRLYVVSEVEPVGGRTLDLYQLHLRVRSKEPKVYQMSAQLRPFKDTLHSDSITYLTAEYKEFPQKLLEIFVRGHLREGSYDVSVRHEFASGQTQVSGQAGHLPLHPLAEISDLSGLDPKTSWISFQVQTEGKPEELSKKPLLVTDFHLEGDIGDVRSARFLLELGPPTRLKDGRFDIRSLDITRLVGFLRMKPPPHLAHLGVFKGEAVVRDGDNFEVAGTQSGMQFIFSNRGTRELQSVSEFKARVIRRKGHWSLDVSDVALEGGTFDGDVRVTANEDFREADVRARIETMILQSRVQKLMTGGGEIGPIDGRLQLGMAAGRVQRLKGVTRFESFQFPNGRLEKILLRFDDKDGGILLVPYVEKLTFARKSPVFDIFGALPLQTWADSEDRISFQGITGRLTLDGLSNVRWTQFLARSALNGAIVNSDGGWNSLGQLDGRVSVRTPQALQRWTIEGTRDNPRFNPVK